MLRKTKLIARSSADFFIYSRGVGHTRLMMEGLRHYEGEVLLVAHTKAHADLLAQEAMDGNPKLKVLARGLDGPPLRGQRLPVVYDNSALQHLFLEISDEISTLERKLRALLEE